MIRDTFLNAADRVDAVSTGDALQPMQVVRAALDNRSAGSDDLVARALAILEQGTMRANSRSSRLATIASEFAPPPVSPRPTPAADLQLQRRVLSDGADCFLPIRYFDVQCLVTSFLVAPGRASELVAGAGAGLQAVLQEDGKAIVDLFCIEYRKTDIGPYNEVGLTVRAKAPTDPIAANYVVHLPVTTAVANRAGREIWGYNKFVAAIDVSSNGKTFSTVLRDSDGELIGALDGVRGMSVPTPATDILTFTVHQGQLIKTVIRVLTPSLAGSGHSFVFKVGTSRHPMTTNLRAIGLDGARPVLTTYTDPFQALLFPGRAL
jgi:Acetoacetate decarboxylase (ADC)